MLHLQLVDWTRFFGFLVVDTVRCSQDILRLSSIDRKREGEEEKPEWYSLKNFLGGNETGPTAMTVPLPSLHPDAGHPGVLVHLQREGQVGRRLL